MTPMEAASDHLLAFGVAARVAAGSIKRFGEACSQAYIAGQRQLDPVERRLFAAGVPGDKWDQIKAIIGSPAFAFCPDPIGSILCLLGPRRIYLHPMFDYLMTEAGWRATAHTKTRRFQALFVILMVVILGACLRI